MKGELFKVLKKQVGIGRVLEVYNLCGRLKRYGDQLVGPCPLHGGDHPTAFRVHLGRGLWNCFTACGGGDLVDLICIIEKCSKAAAARIIQRIITTLPNPHVPATRCKPLRRNGRHPLSAIPASHPTPSPDALPPGLQGHQGGNRRTLRGRSTRSPKHLPPGNGCRPSPRPPGAPPRLLRPASRT